MDGTAKINSADREALFALVTTPRPIGLTSKRIADIILALCGIVLLSPFFVICFVATACFSPGPILFRHRRVGFNGKRFDCLKFRTMTIRCAGALTASRSGSRCRSGMDRHAQVAQRFCALPRWAPFAEIQPG
jgi:exopolysaccharide production protein ExoY